MESCTSGELDSPIHYIDGDRPPAVESAESAGSPGRVDGEDLGRKQRSAAAPRRAFAGHPAGARAGGAGRAGAVRHRRTTTAIADSEPRERIVALLGQSRSAIAGREIC